MQHTERIHDLIIIGAGPAGLEMGLAAAEAGLDFVILEQNGIGNNIRSWGHVTLFSPWRMNVSGRGRKAVKLRVVSPDAVCTGAEYVNEYLKPLSETPALAPHIKTGSRVVSLGRKGAFKNTLIGDPSRSALPFSALVEVRGINNSLQEFDFLSRTVVDASGVYGNHRWLGAGGRPCLGEREFASYITYVIENVSDRGSELSGKHVALVGGGYSACSALESFDELIRSGCDLKVSWIVSENKQAPIDLIAGDPLPYRRELGRLANQLVELSRSENNHWLQYFPGRALCAITQAEQSDQIEISLEKSGSTEQELLAVSRIYAMLGYKPDRSLYEELQIHECWATSGPMNLSASLLSQSGADCLNVKSGGPETLQNPEPGFYIIGAKSYGRNSNFLIERLRSQVKIVSELIVNQLADSPGAAQATDS